MNITQLASLYSEFYSKVLLKRKITLAAKFLPEEIDYSIPSIGIGQDGLSLSSLTFVTKNYLCELRLSGADSSFDFDYVAKNSIFNYRIKLWTHEIREDEKVKATFELAEVDISHGIDNMGSKFTFAGSFEDRDKWLDSVTKALPIETVIGFSRHSE